MSFPRIAVVCLAAVTVAGVASGCGLFGPTPEERVRQAAALQEDIEKREAFLELAAEPHPDMRSELQRLLREAPDPTVRALAAEALGRLGSKQDVEFLRQALRNDDHWLVRSRSLEWLSRVLQSGAADDIGHALKNDRNPLVRAEAVRMAVLHAPEDQLYPLLLQALGDPSGGVRMLACVELQTFTGGSFPPARGPWQTYLRRSGLLQGGQ